MKKLVFICTAALLALPAFAQQTRPQIETRKVEGTDGVYIFRNGNHQSIFIVTRSLNSSCEPTVFARWRHDTRRRNRLQASVPRLYRADELR